MEKPYGKSKTSFSLKYVGEKYRKNMIRFWNSIKTLTRLHGRILER